MTKTKTVDAAALDVLFRDACTRGNLAFRRFSNSSSTASPPSCTVTCSASDGYTP